jgi:lipoate-protein ligase A
MATLARSGPVVGAVLTPGVVTSQLTELYNYDALRSEPEATLFVVRPDHATLVLGSAQTLDVLDARRVGEIPLRRRRGGGGLVLLRPDDIWIDWWIPVDDVRWRSDVHASSRMAGEWWADVLKEFVRGEITVHDGALEGDLAYRLVCFAGRGPGEVFVDGIKAVGVTQWRVREGIFVSTVMHAHPSTDILGYLREVPVGLDHALNHHVLSSLTDLEPETLIAALSDVGGPWQRCATDLHT